MSYLINPYKVSVPAPTPDFFSNYDVTADWTKVGTKITVNETVSDVGYFDNIENASGRNIIHQALGLTMSNSLWYATFTFTISAVTNFGTGWWWFLTDVIGIPEVDTVDGIGVEIANILTIRGYANDATTASVSTNIAISVGVTYYATLERTSATNCTLNIYSNSGRTTHITGSPQSWTMSSGTIGLDNILSASSDLGGGGRFTTGSVDTTKVFNDATP